ncbi:MAG: hypothetical protein AAF355_14950 [Myxococcota bacterium]
MLGWMCVTLAGAGLVGALYGLWQSLRAAFGASELVLAIGDLNHAGRRALLEEKSALLANIRDLEFERDAGKLSSNDFGRLDRQLRRRAAKVLQLLDEDIEPYRAQAEHLIRSELSRTHSETPPPEDGENDEVASSSELRNE